MTPAEAIEALRVAAEASRRAVVVLSRIRERVREDIPEHGPLDREICAVRDELAAARSALERWRDDLAARGRKKKAQEENI